MIIFLRDLNELHQIELEEMIREGDNQELKKALDDNDDIVLADFDDKSYKLENARIRVWGNFKKI